jgi:hypothetical protein
LETAVPASAEFHMKITSPAGWELNRLVLRCTVGASGIYAVTEVSIATRSV